MTDLNVALILRFIDQATGPARAALRNIQGAAERVERFGQAQIAAGRAMQETAANNISALSGQAMAVAGVGYAFAAFMGPAVRFEEQMDRVGALSRSTGEEQQRLIATARELGRSTQYSAGEVADGMGFLAQAGFGVNETISAMPGLLNLAAAAQTDLGRTSDITTGILRGFQLSADETGRLGDVLVNTFTSSNTTLESLGHTMAYVAPLASAAGVGLEQVAAMAGTLGNNAFSGEMAGTALRAVLSRLAAPSNEAAEALERLNIQVSDEGGNLRDLPTILGEMDRAMQGMGNVARQELLTTLFGIEAATAAQILTAEAGSGALQTYAETLAESGTAATLAERLTDNASGALERLQGAVDDVRLSLGNGFLPVLSDMAERLVPIVEQIGAWVAANPELVSTIMNLTAGLIALNAGILVLRIGFWWLYGWIGKARVAFGLFATLIGGFSAGGAIGALEALRGRGLAGVTGLADGVDVQVGRMERSLSRLRSSALLGAAAMAWNVLRAPTDPEEMREFAAQNAQQMNDAFRSAPGISQMMSMYEGLFSRVHGRAAPVPPALLNGAETQNAARVVQEYAGRNDLPTTERLTDLRNGAAAIRAEVTALEEQLAALPAPADAYDMGSPAYQQIASQLAARRADLEQIDAALADAEAQAAALTVALGVLSETEVTPEINTQSIDIALARVRQLADQVQRLGSGVAVSATLPGDGVGGARATGGPVHPLGWYRINEQGEELFRPAMSGSIIPASQTRRLMSGASGGAGAVQGDTNNITFHVHGADPSAVITLIQDFFEERARERRYALHDGGLHA